MSSNHQSHNNNNNNNNNKEGNNSNSIFPHVSGIILFTIIGAAMILIYFFVFTQRSADLIAKNVQVCSLSDPHAKDFINSKPLITQVWVYNITNPLQYANGATPNIYETGPYGLFLDQIRFNVEFDSKEGTLEYDTYYGNSDDPNNSCPGCSFSDIITVPNYGYQTTVGMGKNEGGLLLSLTCAPNQIALIGNPVVPYCNAFQRGNSSVNCKCCRPNPLAPSGSAFCKDLASSTSRAGGIMSYLSQHDHGLKLSSKATGFPLSNGVYTSLVRKVTINEVLWGHVSVLLGSLNTAAALSAGQSMTLAQKLTVATNTNTTKDLVDACYFNSTSCPTITSLATGNIALLKFAQCTGHVPSTDVLISRGLTKKRALELKYLEGVSCQPLTPTIVLAAALTKDVAPTKSFRCADGSNQLPCCLKVFHSYTFNLHGSGLGCIQWVGGLVQLRRAQSDDEALQTLGSLHEKINTACASKDKRYQMDTYKGQSSSRLWYTSSTYNYPNMTWADNPPMRTALSSTSSVGYTIGNVSGEIFALHEPKGFEPQFLSTEMVDSTKPLKDIIPIWVGFRRGTLPFKYVKDVTINKITANYYETQFELSSDRVELEKLQRNGMVPYQNIFDTYYTSNGRPIIMSAPNFYGSESIVLSQSNNQKRRSNLTVGVNLYRTRDGYDKDSTLLTTPSLITTETWDTFYESYIGTIAIEPATGVTLDGSVVNQMSTHTWNCDTSVDPTCALYFYNKTFSRGRLCYKNGQSSYPCSANNVFTPFVMGGKILPIFWLRASPQIPSTVFNAIHGVQRKEFVASILVLVIPILSFVAIVVLFITMLSVRKRNRQVSTTVVELKPLSNPNI